MLVYVVWIPRALLDSKVRQERKDGSAGGSDGFYAQVIMLDKYAHSSSHVAISRRVTEQLISQSSSSSSSLFETVTYVQSANARCRRLNLRAMLLQAFPLSNTVVFNTSRQRPAPHDQLTSCVPQSSPYRPRMCDEHPRRYLARPGRTQSARNPWIAMPC